MESYSDKEVMLICKNSLEDSFSVKISDIDLELYSLDDLLQKLKKMMDIKGFYFDYFSTFDSTKYYPTSD